MALGHDRNHSDTHVEDLIHFARGHVAFFLQKFENPRHWPRFRFDHCVAILWQDARQIIDQPAAGDVRETFNHSCRHFRDQRLIILVHAK